MGQQLASQQLREFNIGQTELKKWVWSNYNTNVDNGNYVICDIHMPSVAIYKGIVLAGYWIGGGGNTATNQHSRMNVVMQIYPITPSYKITQTPAITAMKLKWWSKDGDANSFRLTMDCSASYKSMTLVFWEMPVNDYYSNPKGIRLGDPRFSVDMTGYTLKYTGP